MKLSIISACTALVSIVAAEKSEFLHLGRLIPPVEAADPSLVTIVSQNDAMGSGLFDQILDHKDLSKGTFKQKFWWNIEFWGGPGYPVRIILKLMEVIYTNFPRSFFSHQARLRQPTTEDILQTQRLLAYMHRKLRVLL